MRSVLLGRIAWKLIVGFRLIAILCISSLQPVVCAAQQGSDKGSVAIELSLEKAIQVAIETNLTTSLARERQREARGMKRERLAPLLPNLSSQTFQSNNTENLFAQGFISPAIPEFIGPFRTFDARLFLSQTIFDFSAVRAYQSAQVGEG